MFYLEQSPSSQRAQLLNQPATTKQKVSRFFGIILLASCLLIALASTAQAQSTHRVRVGETLGSIAAKYGTSVNAIASHNGISNPNHIYVGQLLTIPGSGRGSANSGSTQQASTVKQKTYVPTSSGPARSSSSSASGTSGVCRRSARAGEQIYYVRSGDTLSRIASRFGVALSALRNANGLWSDRISIGQCVIIPSGVRATPAPSRPQSRPVVNAIVTPAPLRVSTAESNTRYNTP